MHVSAKRISFLGLLAAFSTLLVILSGIIEINTLFLLALASFGVGISIREYGFGMGIGYSIATIALSLILAPNKIYCITYSAMCIYLLLSEVIFHIFGKLKVSHKFNLLFILFKYMVFNVIYIPILFISPKLIFAGRLNTTVLLLLVVGGQIALYIYETAHNYFHKKIWGKYRIRILGQ